MKFRDLIESTFKNGDEVYYNNSKNVNDELNGEKFTILNKVGNGYKIGSNKLKTTLTVNSEEIHLVEARDKSVPTEYRIGLGQLQAFYGDKHNSGAWQKDFDETCEMIGKKLKIKDIKHFVRWCETQMSFKMPMGKPIKEGSKVTIKVTVSKARDANDAFHDELRGQYKTDGSNVFIFDKRDAPGALYTLSRWGIKADDIEVDGFDDWEEYINESKNLSGAVKDFNSLDSIESAKINHDGNIDIIVKKDVDFTEWEKAGISKVLKKHNLYMYHAYNGLSGTSFEIRAELTYGEVMKYLGDLMYKNRDELTSSVEMYLSKNLK